MSLLFLVRHGQASFLGENYDKLSSLGERQARLLGEYWAHRRMAFDRVLSGPRARQMETARIAGEPCKSAGLNWPETEIMEEFDEYPGEAVMDRCLPALIENNPRIRELNQAFRNAVEAREKHKSFQRLFEVVIGKWAAGEIQAEGVESWQEFSARVRHGLSQISAGRGSGEQVALFSSGGPVGITTQLALDLRPEATLKVLWMARNCSVNEFLFSGERFTLSSFNSIAHLDDPSLVTYR